MASKGAFGLGARLCEILEKRLKICSNTNPTPTSTVCSLYKNRIAMEFCKLGSLLITLYKSFCAWHNRHPCASSKAPSLCFITHKGYDFRSRTYKHYSSLFAGTRKLGVFR